MLLSVDNNTGFHASAASQHTKQSTRYRCKNKESLGTSSSDLINER